MYLKQMGQVPLLTREQEVEISKRIEEAETWSNSISIASVLSPAAHLDLAQKLAEGGERFDRVILDKKIESRERYMKNAAAPVQAGGETERHPSASSISEVVTRPFKEGVAKTQGLPKIGGVAAKALPKFLFQTEGDRRIRASGRRGASRLADMLQAELAKNPRSKKRRLQLQD